MDWNNQNVRLAISFIVGAIVGVALYAIIDANRTDTTSTLSSNITATTTTPVIEGDNGVLVNDQSAGNKVEVTQVVFKTPGWVAIHDDVNGQPGKILGAKLFDSGKMAGSVDLLRSTENGKSYFAVLHTDDGNYKNFNAQTDTILKDAKGQMIMVKFTTGTMATSSAVVSPPTSVTNLGKE
ncbi:MAG: hypothetical protein M3Q63_00850 [bacterium]|nr:hypothetical protein [bacterium]